jgi:hypothetical protein
MRFERLSVTLCVLLLAIPAWGKQASQSAATFQPASDPQAVAVVQAAITALGGATAISQAQSWTFEAQMQGPHANGNVDYVISTDTDTEKIMRPDGSMKPARPIHSHFVPALVGAILLRESQDPEFITQYVGASTVDSKPVTVVALTIGRSGFPAQIWAFDGGNLPVQIDFRLPAEIGARQSVYGLVSVSDYQTVSGVLYPYRIVSFLKGKAPENITLQSVNASTAAPVNEYNGVAGDLR